MNPRTIADPMNLQHLQHVASQIRKAILRMHRRGSNVASAMSAADIVTVLYFDILHLPSPTDPARDRFFLSKGHAVAALYGALALKGLIDPAELEQYITDGSRLTGHPSTEVPGVELATGSLGHALAIAAGQAWAARADGKTHRHFVLMGDGEQQEGSVWESAALVARLKLDRVVGIVDANRLQGYDRTDAILPVDSLADKWRAFGWAVREVSGHDLRALRDALAAAPFEPGKPSMLLAHTIKGKGVKEMEDTLGWHYFSVPPEKLGPFCDELDGEK